MFRADNLATFVCLLSLNVGTSNSWTPEGLSRLVMELLFLSFVMNQKVNTDFSQLPYCSLRYLFRRLEEQYITERLL